MVSGPISDNAPPVRARALSRSTSMTSKYVERTSLLIVTIGSEIVQRLEPLGVVAECLGRTGSFSDRGVLALTVCSNGKNPLGWTSHAPVRQRKSHVWPLRLAYTAWTPADADAELPQEEPASPRHAKRRSQFATHG